MTQHRWLPSLLAAAALVAVIDAAAEDAPPAADPPTGQLLIASASLSDPRFFHSVVLLLRHDPNGAFGIVINHPLGERTLAALLADAAGKDGADENDSKIEGTIRVYLGGPVQQQLGFIVHSGDYRRAETLVVGDTLGMTASKEVLRDIGRKKGPAQYLFALGYAGWGAGQLENEMAHRAWFTAPAQSDLVFDAEPDTIWERALARRSREL